MSGPGPVARDDATTAFFDAAARGVLLLQACPDGHASEPAAAVCGTCGSTRLSPSPASGRAVLVSWAVVHGRDEAEPTVVGVLQVEEGPWLWGRLVRVEPTGPAVGDPFSVEFVRPEGGGESVPVWTPSPAG